MKKTLFLVSQYHGNGGIPRFNRNLIRALQEKKDINLTIISLNDGEDFEYGVGCDSNKFTFIVKFIRFAFFEKPDFIIIGLLNFVSLSLLKIISSLKFIVIIHGVEAWATRKTLKPFFRFVNEFWAVSFYTKKQFSKNNGVDPHKIKRIFNTIPNNWINEGTTNNDSSYILSVTRLDSNEGYKGIDKTILALKSIESLVREKKYKYLIVASGNDLDRHKELVKTIDLEDIVEFKSDITDKKLMALYKDCSFFVLPSDGEGFGIVFLEAMAFHKPCIGSKNCGTEDVIQDEETGYLINPEVIEIKERIEYLISNQVVRNKMGNAGYKKLMKEFTFKRFLKKIHSLI